MPRRWRAGADQRVPEPGVHPRRRGAEPAMAGDLDRAAGTRRPATDRPTRLACLSRRALRERRPLRGQRRDHNLRAVALPHQADRGTHARARRSRSDGWMTKMWRPLLLAVASVAAAQAAPAWACTVTRTAPRDPAVRYAGTDVRRVFGTYRLERVA